MNILVIAAHPDDEVLGCGGTIARNVSEGHTVSILILGEGVSSRYQKREDVDPKQLQILHHQAKEVGVFLGASQVSLAGLPDNQFDTVALLDIVKIIEDHIERVRPEIIFTQHGGDLNIDHHLTFRATLTATRPTEESSVARVYGYEVNSSTEWAFQRFQPTFQPNTFVDIAPTLEKKIKAMKIYEGESRPFPHPRSSEALSACAAKWGSVAGVQAAEAFELIRDIQR